MSRNFYILAGAFLLFAVVSLGMSWTPGAHDPGMPGEAQIWRTMAFLFFFASALVCLIGTITNTFEQASRRHREQQPTQRRQPPKA